MQDFQRKFRLNDLTIHNYQYWVLSLRPQQLTLGSMVLSLKRPCTSLADLTADESQELGSIFHDVEQCQTALFAFDKINYLALMMVDNQVHMHILPRYQQSRDFAGIRFIDEHWPGPVTDFSKGCSDDGVLYQILNAIKTEL